MCDICNGKTIGEYLDGQRDTLAQYGWSIQAVGFGEDEDGALPWAYTIGLAAGFGHPELVVCGHDIRLAAQLLNGMGDDVRAGTLFAAGEVEERLGRTIRLRAVHRSHFHRTRRFAGWIEYYDTFGPPPTAQAIQLVLPDGCACHRQPDLSLPVPLAGGAVRDDAATGFRPRAHHRA